jgi:uncharacterized ion transporter superfamily protein YfcC
MNHMQPLCSVIAIAYNDCFSQFDNTMKKDTRRKMPETLVLIFWLALVVWLMTWLIPQGSFDSQVVEYESAGKTTTREVLDGDSFAYAVDESGDPKVQALPVFGEPGSTGFLNAAFDGLTRGSRSGGAVAVIAFLLIIGGAFGIIMAPQSMNKSLVRLLAIFGDKGILVVPILCFVFSLGGAVFGMSEEAIAFALILAPIFKAQGFSAITVVLTTYGATQIGFATSWMNPFNVAIAQGLAGVPVLSGAGFRFVMWCVFTAIMCAFSTWYAHKNRQQTNETVFDFETTEMTWGDRLIMLNLFVGMVWVIWGVSTRGYYIAEIATQFFTIGLSSALITLIFKLDGLAANDLAVKFQKGAAELLPAALIVGFAQGLIVILGGANPTEPTVLNTVLHHTGEAIGGFGDSTAALLMFSFQSCFNFFVASGSGQAALTMPLMAPLSDLVDVTRQTAVLAFQLGDGLTNLIVPTSASLMGCLGVAKVSWSEWAGFVWKFLLFNIFLAAVFLITAVNTGF